jgi:N-carbamoyl-L-amino-acid hydrolase
MRPLSAIPPVPLAEEMIVGLERACEELGVEATRMPSMAGHDAMSVGEVAPAGLFFIPSLKGISHRPDENSRKEDIKLAGDVLCHWALGELERAL